MSENAEDGTPTSFVDAIEQAVLRHIRFHEIEDRTMGLVDTEALAEAIAGGVKSWLGRPLPKPTPKLTYENRYCEWLMGRYGQGGYEVRMEYRLDSKDWWIWPVKYPDQGFRAEGHYEEVGRKAHEIADELRKVVMAEAEAKRAMRRAKAVT